MNTDNKFFGYLKTRGVGFYLLLPAALFAFIIAFVYLGTFVGQDRYWSVIVFLLPLFAVLAYGLSYYKHTAKYAAVVMFVCLLAGLLMTVNTIYYYIADVVFKAGEGVSVFKAIGSNVAFLFVAYAIDLIICIVAAFFKQYTVEKADKPESVEEVAQ